MNAKDTNARGTHTPGPWTVDYTGPARLGITAQGETLALGNLQCEDGDKDEGNMQLMAAAPELLAALEAIHSCHRAFSGNDNWTMIDDEARELAERAIAKARGAV